VQAGSDGDDVGGQVLAVGVGGDHGGVGVQQRDVRQPGAQGRPLAAVDPVVQHGGAQRAAGVEHGRGVGAVVDDQQLEGGVQPADGGQQRGQPPVGLEGRDQEDGHAMYRTSEVPRSEPLPSGSFTSAPSNTMVEEPPPSML